MRWTFPSSRRLAPGALLVAAVVIAGNLLAFELRSTFRAAGDAATLAAEPLVGRPTASGVTVNLIAADAPVAGELVIAEGPTVPFRLDAGAATYLDVQGLAPGREYRYEVQIAGATAASGRFVTQRAPGDAFTFAVFGDSHLPVLANDQETGGFESRRARVSETLTDVMDHIRVAEPDFIVGLGDLLHIEGRRGEDSFNTLDAAERAYDELRARLGRTTAEAALFSVVGNWEGENGWRTGAHHEWARTARHSRLPNPQLSTYPQRGSTHEDYFAWSWGDALFIALNVVGYTPENDLSSQVDREPGAQWTLGTEQMRWLRETLAAAHEPFKFVFIHHPVGGRGADAKNSNYGRGGGRAAYIGEQREVHELMVAHEVQAFFYGHDHVFTDMVVDGVHYTLPGSAGAPWKFGSEFTGYDWYDRRSGFGLVHVQFDRAVVEFVDTAGVVFHSFEVLPSPVARSRPQA